MLGGLLPESLLYVLEKSGAQAFAAAMVADSDTPEIIWTHKMRSERLIHQVSGHMIGSNIRASSWQASRFSLRCEIHAATAMYLGKLGAC